MNDSEFLDNKFKEINILKNKLEKYPIEYRKVIIEAINGICDEVNKGIDSQALKQLYTSREMEIKVYLNRRKEEDKLLTIDELTKYNGLNGERAYVAVNGVVYDVTDSKAWNLGKHYGLTAGKDLSSYFNTCHNEQTKIIENLPVIGQLSEQK